MSGLLSGQKTTINNAADTGDLFDVTAYGGDKTGVADIAPAIRSAMAAAVANVTSTGRRSTIYFPSGVYNFKTKTTIREIDINGYTKLTFAGAPGGRTRIHLAGNAGAGDWYMFTVRGGSSQIVFQDLYMDHSGISNPDPAQQNHCLQIGDTGATDTKVLDCEFGTTVGDCIRLIANKTTLTDRVTVFNCRFVNFGRSAISVQRYCRELVVDLCHFEGGSDQHIDFEPTAYNANADVTGSDATTLTDVSENFTAQGVEAGEEYLNQPESTVTVIRSVDSATQLTTSTVGSWAGDAYIRLAQLRGHRITNSRFIRGSSASVTIAMTGAYQTLFADNYVEGDLDISTFAVDVAIVRNVFKTSKINNGVPRISLQGHVKRVEISYNTITTDRTTPTDLKSAIKVENQSGTCDQIFIRNNRIRANCAGDPIIVSGLVGSAVTRRVEVTDNFIIRNTTTTNGVAIYVEASDVKATGNVIGAVNGGYTGGIECRPTGAYKGCIVGGGAIDSCTTPIIFTEDSGSGYLFTTPPVLVPGNHHAGTITPPVSMPWLLIGGVGGAGPTTNSKKPGIFWGSGSPEGVLTAGIGAIATRYDGSAGTVTYIKNSGTGSTGWVPIGGAVATGTITCVAKASMVDTDYCTIGDGIGVAKLYEFDVAGDGVTAGRVQVNISTDTTATDVAARLVTAINANQPALSATNAAGVVTITHKIANTLGNVAITENVADVGFTVTGMSGGVNPAR